MFVWAKYPFEIDSISFAFKAIEQTGVLMVPGATFGSNGEGYMRLALVQDVEVLIETVERLRPFSL